MYGGLVGNLADMKYLVAGCMLFAAPQGAQAASFTSSLDGIDFAPPAPFDAGASMLQAQQIQRNALEIQRQQIELQRAQQLPPQVYYCRLPDGRFVVCR